MNKVSAGEWLVKAWHHYGSATILYEANHYTDTIAVDLHYAVETALKSFLAYENKKIVKSHDLLELAGLIEAYITFDEDELSLMDKITTYHIKGSYPTLDRKLPSREEIKEVLVFTEKLFDKICVLLKIDKKELV